MNNNKKMPFEYTVGWAPPHTCWDAEDWDGTMQTATCAACSVAEQHPCRVCGYGHVFVTHNAERHTEAGDPYWNLRKAGMQQVMEWAERPHIYKHEPHKCESLTLFVHDECVYCGRGIDGDGVPATRQEGVGLLMLVGEMCPTCQDFHDCPTCGRMVYECADCNKNNNHNNRKGL